MSTHTSEVKVVSHMARFIAKNTQVMDKALNDTGVDILRLSKAQVPHDTGNLQSSGRLTRNKLMSYEVSYNASGVAPYARRWEYTTPLHGFHKGRKSHYLSDPGEMETRQDKMFARFKQAAKDIGVKL